MYAQTRGNLRPEFCPSLLTPGVLGPDRARDAWEYTQRSLLDNAIPMDFRVALLCVSWERPTAPSGIHATGMSLLAHVEAPVDLSDIWARMMADAATRRMLMVTRHLGACRDVPYRAVQEVQSMMGPWKKSWQDLMAFSAWADALYRAALPQVSPLEDERLDLWMEELVSAGQQLPPLRDALNWR